MIPKELIDLVSDYGSACLESGLATNTQKSSFDEFKESIEHMNTSRAKLLDVIESLIKENDYNKKHTLIECPQCGFNGAREYDPVDRYEETISLFGSKLLKE